MVKGGTLSLHFLLMAVLEGHYSLETLLQTKTYVMQQPFENYSGLLLVVVDWINIVTNKSQE